MALPPEQINIKRRREEEPVETLYIQSALHQTKRRFTDFVFQRVPLKTSDEENDSGSNTSAPPHPAAQRLLRSPRSVSSLHVNRRAAATPQPTTSNGVPRVRATSPGAEIRDAQRRATAQKEADEKRKRALNPESQSQPQTELLQPTSVSASASAPLTPSSEIRSPGPGSEGTSGAGTPSSSRAASVRRFQISRTSSPALGLRTGGIQKRRTEGSPGVAVLVEQLQRTQHSRKASMVADLVGQAKFNEKNIVIDPSDPLADPVPVKPRKRPVVNQAERKWREDRKNAVSAAKMHLSETLEKSAREKAGQSWDEESEKLAREFEKVALELENDMEVDDHDDDDYAYGGVGGAGGSRPVRANAGSNASTASPQQSKTDYSRFASPAASSLKYQPRLPKEPRAVVSQSDTTSQSQSQSTEKDEADSQAVDDNDEDYVYDVYIRRPLAETDILTNPLAELESDQQLKDLEASRAGVGVIVITAEDEEYWENFIEDDEEEWDSEDADSNAENNPANDYPDEELSSSDEDDDPTAIYGKYRRHGVSSDEEFDIDDSGSESGARFGSAFGYRQRYGGHVDSDDESDE